MFNPWAVIDANPHITVEYREFDLWSGATNGIDTVYLDPRLLEVERRCTLTHELVHISRRHSACQPAAVEKVVRHETARLLVHVQDLYREMQWAHSHEELAAELAVTPRVLSDRLGCLTVPELDYLRMVDLEDCKV